MKAVAALRKKSDPLARFDLGKTNSAHQLKTGQVELDQELADGSSVGGRAQEDDGNRRASVETKCTEEACEDG